MQRHQAVDVDEHMGDADFATGAGARPRPDHHLFAAKYRIRANAARPAQGQYLDDRELGEIADDLGEMAKRHPGAVFGGMFLAGLIIGRFIKAGEQEEEE